MTQIIRANQRYSKDAGWLQAKWLFSFSDYYDPENIRFGDLRVYNDDVVAPGGGFPTHPHEEVEIVTLVLEGEITHEDSMGNRAVVEADDVQTMSAGTGISHSEYNLSNEPLHLYQIWIYPDKKGLKPSYDQKSFDRSSFKNRLLPIASGQNIPDTAVFHADATVYRSILGAGKGIDYQTNENRKIFVYVTSGILTVNGDNLYEEDQARIHSESNINIMADQDADFILIDVNG
jgi:redox-sensitive bicupin YhaK (pirin superfamily)